MTDDNPGPYKIVVEAIWSDGTRKVLVLNTHRSLKQMWKYIKKTWGME